MTAAARQRLYRTRAAAGRICLTIEANEVALGELLADAGLLKTGPRRAGGQGSSAWSRR
jgi:hypothetical protein